VQVAVLGGGKMTAEEIRKSQSDVTTMAETWTDSSASANATLLLHVFRMLAEIAAQLAELNENSNGMRELMRVFAKAKGLIR